MKSYIINVIFTETMKSERAVKHVDPMLSMYIIYLGHTSTKFSYWVVSKALNHLVAFDKPAKKTMGCA